LADRQVSPGRPPGPFQPTENPKSKIESFFPFHSS
jgi:hypothetical protein